MKSLFLEAFKNFVGMVAFLIGLGWATYGAVLMIVKAEGQEIRKEVMTIRVIDMDHINKRFDETQELIRSSNKK
jgi:hypothetical protein